MKRPKPSKQRVVNILDVFIAYSVDAEVVAVSLANKFVKQLACLFKSLDNWVRSNF